MTPLNSTALRSACRSITNARGFTLIEVMAALVIVSLGMLAVIQAVSETANNNAYLRQKAIAHWVAMNRVTEMRLAPQAPPTGESSGEVEMGGQRWRWSAQVTQTAVTTMHRIDVGVAALSDAKATLDNPDQLVVITGFYGDKIAQPGTILAQFDAPPIATQQQQTGPGTQTPPVKTPTPTSSSGP
jgi:general secretion pathway protein I